MLSRLKLLLDENPHFKYLIPDFDHYKKYAINLGFCSHLLNPLNSGAAEKLLKILQATLPKYHAQSLSKKSNNYPEINWLQEMANKEQIWFGHIAELAFAYYLKSQPGWSEIKVGKTDNDSDVSGKYNGIDYIFEIKCVGIHPEILKSINQETGGGFIGSGFPLFLHKLYDAVQ